MSKKSGTKQGGPTPTTLFHLPPPPPRASEGIEAPPPRRSGAARQDREGPPGRGLQEAPAPAARVPAGGAGAHPPAVPHVHGFLGLDQDGALHRPLLGQHCQPGGSACPLSQAPGAQGVCVVRIWDGQQAGVLEGGCGGEMATDGVSKVCGGVSRLCSVDMRTMRVGSLVWRVGRYGLSIWKSLALNCPRGETCGSVKIVTLGHFCEDKMIAICTARETPAPRCFCSYARKGCLQEGKKQACWKQSTMCRSWGRT